MTLTSTFDFNIFLGAGSLAWRTRFGLPRPGCGFDRCGCLTRKGFSLILFGGLGPRLGGRGVTARHDGLDTVRRLISPTAFAPLNKTKIKCSPTFSFYFVIKG